MLYLVCLALTILSDYFRVLKHYATHAVKPVLQIWVSDANWLWSWRFLKGRIILKIKVGNNFRSYYKLFLRVSESCSVVSDSLQPHGVFSPWNSSGQNTGIGSPSLLQGIFSIQQSNPGLPHLFHKTPCCVLETIFTD